jgi:hypothetical protein
VQVAQAVALNGRADAQAIVPANGVQPVAPTALVPASAIPVPVAHAAAPPEDGDEVVQTVAPAGQVLPAVQGPDRIASPGVAAEQSPNQVVPPESLPVRVRCVSCGAALDVQHIQIGVCQTCLEPLRVQEGLMALSGGEDGG